MERRKDWLVALCILALVIAMCAFIFINRCRRESGHIDAASTVSQRSGADQEVLRFVPREATDVRYMVAPYDWYAEIAFRIGEQDLVAWTTEHGWGLKTISFPLIVTGWTDDHWWSSERYAVEVRSGLYGRWEQTDGDRRYQIDLVFDATSQAAYMNVLLEVD